MTRVSFQKWVQANMLRLEPRSKYFTVGPSMNFYNVVCILHVLALYVRMVTHLNRFGRMCAARAQENEIDISGFSTFFFLIVLSPCMQVGRRHRCRFLNKVYVHKAV